MRVQVPLHAALLSHAGGVEGILEAYRQAYSRERFVTVAEARVFGISDELVFLDPRSCNGTNCVQIHVVGHPNGHVVLVAILDNLGKGASGAAVQSLNLMLGLDEATGLTGASTVLGPVPAEAAAG
jgi:N-acetyl-gamma-glutamyl-phosphate reductase